MFFIKLWGLSSIPKIYMLSILQTALFSQVLINMLLARSPDNLLIVNHIILCFRVLIMKVLFFCGIPFICSPRCTHIDVKKSSISISEFI